MYLKRITIVGFKSFANKTVLDLERGMTAVVGPNGSGKSNVADAIRWALGEQSKSRLRLTDREEVVFAGTERRARASYAEVTLVFNNDDGVFGLDLTEVEIRRRLYRSGETEYQLAGRPVKLGDLQQLLANAGFGVGSYAVIGQGTIDSLLMSSPAERKLLFDEAAGIRGAELGRESAQRKLAATETNLVRLRDITAELAPRAASLERATQAAAEQVKLEKKVSDLRATILATAEAQCSDEMYTIKKELAGIAAKRQSLEQSISELKITQRDQQQAASKAAAANSEGRAAIALLERKRDTAAAKLSELQSKQSVFERVISGSKALQLERARLSKAGDDLQSEQAELITDLAAIEAQAVRAKTSIATAQTGVTEAQSELIEVRQQLTDGTRQQYVGHALSLVKTMALHLDAPELDAAELRLLIHKTGRLLSHASRTGEADLAARLKGAQVKLEAAMAKRETASEHLANITLSRRSIELEQQRQMSVTESLAADSARLSKLELEVVQARADFKESEVSIKLAQASLAEVTSELATVRLAGQISVDTSAIAEIAVKIERSGSELHELGRRASGLSITETEMSERLLRYQARGRSWGVESGRPDLKTGLVELDQTLVRLEGELAARTQLGVDLRAEYSEVTTRQHELVEQIADLEAASVDLTSLVAKLSAVVQERFKANFERLGVEFSRQSQRLFGGGNASLELIEDEAGQYGINIKVSPNGKRLSSLAALSGGERALAGVALLSAILVVNPSPFVVLDEIDAALDDANSGRLADIMGELAARSQLIVITHNRQTMKAARVLFGVTMDGQHVSTLLSLRLEEAAQLAAR